MSRPWPYETCHLDRYHSISAYSTVCQHGLSETNLKFKKLIELGPKSERSLIGHFVPKHFGAHTACFGPSASSG